MYDIYIAHDSPSFDPKDAPELRAKHRIPGAESVASPSLARRRSRSSWASVHCESKERRTSEKTFQSLANRRKMEVLIGKP